MNRLSFVRLFSFFCSTINHGGSLMRQIILTLVTVLLTAIPTLGFAQANLCEDLVNSFGDAIDCSEEAKGAFNRSMIFEGCEDLARQTLTDLCGDSGTDEPLLLDAPPADDLSDDSEAEEAVDGDDILRTVKPYQFTLMRKAMRDVNWAFRLKDRDSLRPDFNDIKDMMCEERIDGRRNRLRNEQSCLALMVLEYPTLTVPDEWDNTLKAGYGAVMYRLNEEFNVALERICVDVTNDAINAALEVYMLKDRELTVARNAVTPENPNTQGIADATVARDTAEADLKTEREALQPQCNGNDIAYHNGVGQILPEGPSLSRMFWELAENDEITPIQRIELDWIAALLLPENLRNLHLRGSDPEKGLELVTEPWQWRDKYVTVYTPDGSWNGNASRDLTLTDDNGGLVKEFPEGTPKTVIVHNFPRLGDRDWVDPPPPEPCTEEKCIELYDLVRKDDPNYNEDWKPRWAKVELSGGIERDTLVSHGNRDTTIGTFIAAIMLAHRFENDIFVAAGPSVGLAAGRGDHKRYDGDPGTGVEFLFSIRGRAGYALHPLFNPYVSGEFFIAPDLGGAVGLGNMFELDEDGKYAISVAATYTYRPLPNIAGGYNQNGPLPNLLINGFGIALGFHF